MSLYVACACGRAIAVPDGQRGGSVACPDCGRPCRVDGAPISEPIDVEVPRRMGLLVSDLGCLSLVGAAVVLAIAFPGLGKTLGIALVACCAAPMIGGTLAAWIYLRRIRRMAQERMEELNRR